jgi:hypothetical protein
MASVESSMLPQLGTWSKNNPEISITNGCSFQFSFDIKANIAVIDSEKPTNLTQFVSNIIEVNNFEKADLPYIIIDFSLPVNISLAIQDSYRDTQFLITKKYSKSLLISENKKGETKIIWKEKKFRILEPSKIENGEDKSGGNADLGSLTTNNDTFRFIFFEEGCLNMRKSIVNTVFNNCTIGDAIGYLLGDFSFGKKVTIQKPDNSTVYENIFVPPMDFPSSLEYLQLYYNIYNDGIKYFFDVNNIIITGKSSSLMPEGIYDTVLLDFITKTPESNRNGKYTFVDDTNKYYNIGIPGYPSSIINDFSLKEINGKDIIVAGKDSIKETVGGGGIVDNMEHSKESYFWNPTSNDNFANMLAGEMNEGVEYLSCAVSNSIPFVFNISTKVKIRFNNEMNKNASGVYRISSLVNSYKLIKMGTQKDGEQNQFGVDSKLDLIRK